MFATVKLFGNIVRHTLWRHSICTRRLYGLNTFTSVAKTPRIESERDYTPEQQETVDAIKLLLEKRIRPIVQQDGGDVHFVSYDAQQGFVYVRLSGSCVGCAQSDITLKHMIQGMLCHYIDEIVAVYNVDDPNREEID